MESLLGILTQQHLDLKQQLDNAKTEASKEKPRGDVIMQVLGTFNGILKEHLTIENGIFYPQILEKMRNRNIRTASAEDFIKKMGVIANDIYKFLSKYDGAEIIENDIGTFKQDLENITAALILRVTSEEDGVYLYWSL